jgi:hypothetical protein
MKWDLKAFVTLIASLSLMGVICSMIWMFVQAVLDPTVDDKIVFDIVGPAFQSICGGFLGLITGIHIGAKDDKPTE